MKKYLGILTAVSAFAFFANAGPSYRSSGSSFSGSRSSSSFSASRPSASGLYNKPSAASSSSSGYSKPAPVASNSSSGGYSKPSQPSVSSGGYSKPVAKSDGISAPTKVPVSNPPTAFAKGNRFDSDTTRKLQMQKSQTSLAAYETEKNQFKNPPTVKVDQKTFKSNPVVSSHKVYSRVGYDDVQERRRTRFGGWNPPVVIYQAAPSYGSWNSTFLWWSLWNDQAFFYHHRNDPAYEAWHNDALKLAEQNGEMKAKLADMDNRMKEMERNGTAKNSAYMPAQVEKDPLVALSNEAIESIPVEKPSLKLATGISGGQYHQIGNLLKRKAAGFNIELIATSGAAENLQLLQSGKVDAAIVQSDTDFVKGKISPELSGSSLPFHRATLYCEYVMLVVAKDSPIKSVSDLSKENTVYVGPDGSGSSTTWSGFVMQDSHYKEVKVQNLDYTSAFERVGADKNKALLFVAGMNTPLLSEAAKKGQYRIVPVDDKDLSSVLDKDGHAVYDVLTLPANTYPGMQNGELKTLGVEAEWTISDAWIEKVGNEAFDQINYAVIDRIKDMHQVAEQAVPEKMSSHALTFIMLGLIIMFFGWFLLTKVNVTGGVK